VEAAQPDIVLLMPCGYSIDRTIQELVRIAQGQNEWRRLFDHRPRSYVVDAASYFSRPGPRLVDGVELLATILHPSPDHPVDPNKAINLESAISGMDGAS
jgi:iron complex transport system substrate-binding protein